MDNTINKSATALSSDLNIENKKPVKGKEADQDIFMKLMIAQMKNQDPTSPTDGKDFLAQLASFNTVSGITKLQKSVDELAASLQSSQALQASTLVGRTVVTKTDSIEVARGKPQAAMVDLEAGVGSLTVEIQNKNGEIVRKLNLGQNSAGRVAINWDGLDEAGHTVADGSYKIKAESVAKDETTAHQVLAQSKVNSVTLPRDGGAPMLNIAGVGQLSMDTVKEFI